MDVITIRAGLKKISSPNWSARLFVSDPYRVITRDLAPELRHAGLLITGPDRPALAGKMCRDLPLFGMSAPFPDMKGKATLFLTSSKDDLSNEELDLLSDLLFSNGTWAACKIRRGKVGEMEVHFRSLMNFWRQGGAERSRTAQPIRA